MSAESVPGEGSCFTLLLPAPAPAEPAEPAEAAERRILVVEPDPPGLLTVLARSAVADRDTTVDSAADPDSALAALDRRPPRLIVLDLALPQDGARTLLAALERRPAPVPVIGHTSTPDAPLPDGDRLEITTGLDELRERVGKAAGPPADEPAPAAAPSDRAGRLAGRTVLVVDDDSRNVYALSAALEREGATALHAANGRTGLALLRAHPETDLVLMDLMMPELDGYAATAAIRESAEHANVPIIAVTAKALPDDRARSLAAGADDHLTKPVDTTHLITTVLHWLES